MSNATAPESQAPYVWVEYYDDGWHNDPPGAVYGSVEAAKAAHPGRSWVGDENDGQLTSEDQPGRSHSGAIILDRFEVIGMVRA